MPPGYFIIYFPFAALEIASRVGDLEQVRAALDGKLLVNEPLKVSDPG